MQPETRARESGIGSWETPVTTVEARLLLFAASISGPTSSMLLLFSRHVSYANWKEVMETGLQHKAIERAFYIQQYGGKDILVWQYVDGGMDFAAGVDDGALMSLIHNLDLPGFRWFRVSGDYVYEAMPTAETVRHHHARYDLLFDYDRREKEKRLERVRRFSEKLAHARV